MLAGRGVDRESRPRLLCGADEARQATQADGEKCFHQPLFYPGSRLARASQMVARVNFLDYAQCGLAVGEGNRGSFEDFAGFDSLYDSRREPRGSRSLPSRHRGRETVRAAESKTGVSLLTTTFPSQRPRVQLTKTDRPSAMKLTKCRAAPRSVSRWAGPRAEAHKTGRPISGKRRRGCASAGFLRRQILQRR